jgi:hypothetical protein
MEKRLKQSLGIDVSKLKLSLSLGFLTGKLEKEFISREDVSNDLSGYKTLLKWLKKYLKFEQKRSKSSAGRLVLEQAVKIVLQSLFWSCTRHQKTVFQ